MQLRVCPQCYKAFYISRERDAIACQHCGHIFSERRRFGRVRDEFEIILKFNGSEISARAIDYSEAGAGIIYSGDSLEADTILDINIGMDVRRPARMVWSRQVSRSLVSAGLKLL